MRKPCPWCILIGVVAAVCRCRHPAPRPRHNTLCWMRETLASARQCSAHSNHTHTYTHTTGVRNGARAPHALPCQDQQRLTLAVPTRAFPTACCPRRLARPRNSHRPGQQTQPASPGVPCQSWATRTACPGRALPCMCANTGPTWQHLRRCCRVSHGDLLIRSRVSPRPLIRTGLAPQF